MTIERALLAAQLVLSVLAAPLVADAQSARKIPVIGVLSSTGAPSPFAEAFEMGLRELGWSPGQNVTVEYRYAEGKAERFPDLANELVRLSVDVIVAPPAPATLAAKAATTTVPIVFTLGADPTAFGVLAIPPRKDSNLTGLTEIAPELTPKRLELLKEIVPGMTRVAIVWQPGTLREEAYVQLAKEVRGTAQSLGIQLRFVEIRGANELEATFDDIAKRNEAVIVLMSPTFNAQTKRLADLVIKHRLPALYETKSFASAGGLLSYGASISDVWRRSAIFVDKILKGAKPAELPIEQPTKFELVINLKTAKALGLTIPPSLLLRAHQVIE